ncbi:MAG: 4-(cytidine 5'-diphospho)-2-C-methyl-D-erythritol kinase [Halanaerobiales bacterium]
MDQLSIKGHAKINLFLNIKNLREDGYHNLEMVMQSIELHDNLIISAAKRGIDIETNSSEIPTGVNNLVYKAAARVIEKSNFSNGLKIFIEKNIPVAAGLAGGSADAAAVIKGINTFFDLDLDEKELFNIAREVGSDVSFCMRPGTAYVTGKGDQLQYLNPLKTRKVILVKPPVMVSTKKIYELYDKRDNDINIPVEKLLENIKKGDELKIKDGWANVLEPVTKDVVKDIEEIENILINKGFKFTLMSGSGPTVFSLVEKGKEKLAKKLVANWTRNQDFITLTKTI